MREIKLSNSNKFFQVDDEDYNRCIKYNWAISTNEGIIYTNIAHIKTNIGRFIINTPIGLEPDHIDRNIFNNQKSNLRHATKTQNQRNRAVFTTNQSGYKGVFWQVSRRKFLSQIKVGDRRIHLGRFNSSIEAARAYNEAALLHFGEFAVLNSLESEECIK